VTAVASRSRAESFDLAIVGGGAAGCVLARRLSEDGDRRIVLIEAGPDLRGATPPELLDGWTLPTPPDWGYTWGPDASGATGKLRRGRLLGGTSWLTRFAVRGATSDFDAWAAAGNPGWAFADVLPAFRRLEADLDFGDREWHGSEGPIPITRYLGIQPSAVHRAAIEALATIGFPAVDDHNAPGAVGVGRMPMSSRDGRRSTTVDAYLGLDHAVRHLTIRTDAPVDRIRLDGDRATGVILVDGSVIAAGGVILCGGTYGSPAILMRSGIGPADHLHSFGIEVVRDLPGVGSNLADHPAVDLDSGWQGDAVANPVTQSIATFRSVQAGPSDGQDMMFWIIDPSADDPAVYVDPILLRPQSRGSVRLRSVDPAEPPQIDLPGLRETADLERLVDGFGLALELANHPVFRRGLGGGGPVDPGDRGATRAAVRAGLYSIPHVVGTCAMGPSPDAGAVVDAIGRVHGVAGLAVVDASIIPEPPSGFPHIITIMLAEHVAEPLAGLL